ncbi:MucR family transcriptional regulator [Methylobacterium nodulans]|uniref:Transcriptional regulator, MucR family n=1 Tax=Methylobacterium nodulans (strain LMG 21967 / CNCM I-2342 / ORS 2060) TaxID=460265 RepID=B8IAT6_METNO|nr:MucR family transcriptional regulator [Methylobacterium nodulans]ACL61131.1 transcriptional regulator, MucR family [Methylobacterium nodulans ORS 2060]
MSETEAAAVDLSGLTSDIVSAYVSKNNVPSAELPTLIRSVYDALRTIGKPATPAADETPKATPAQIRKSITVDHLVSFIDGKPYKSLKRHLTKHGLTPEAYRAKFGLPRDYPMVAESYARQRSELARSLGLGQIRRERAKAKAAASAPNVAEMVETPAPPPAPVIAEAPAEVPAKKPARRSRAAKAAAE